MAEAYLGEIRIFAGTYAPRGWEFCDGQLLTILGNEALFSLIGTAYGGDGRVSFGLPELRGRAAIHQGTGIGLSPRPIGQRSGVNYVTLTTDQMPEHRHTFEATKNDAISGICNEGHTLGKASDLFYADQPGAVKSVELSEVSIGASGGGQEHQNMQAYQGVHYIIATMGTFPGRN